MERKIILFILVMMSNLLDVSAQELMDSFRQNYVKKMYQSCPDSLKECLLEWKTAYSEYTLNSDKAMSYFENAVQKKADSCLILRYQTADFLVRVYYSDRGNDYQFDFCYVTPQNKLCCLRLLNTEGRFQRNFVTKSGAVYSIDHEWGFMELKENNVGLLNGFFNIENMFDNEAEFTFIPFKGTKLTAWLMPQNGEWVQAF